MSNSSKALAFLTLSLPLGPLLPSTLAQSQLQKLTASDAQPVDLFGTVALHGSLAAVGASLRDGPEDSGAVYLFQRSPGGWSEAQTLLASDASAYASFGSELSLSDQRLLVGAPGADGHALASGAVYLFEADAAGTWVESGKLSALDGFRDDSFGAAIDQWQERVIVGASQCDEHGEGSGAAYVFERFGPQWIQTARLTAPDGAEFDRFGVSVAIEADLAMVGAEGDDDQAPSSGSVYVYRRTPTGWVFSQKLLPSSASTLSGFGASLQLDEQLAVIGAPGSSLAAGAYSGAAFVFEPRRTGWQERAVLLAPDAHTGDRFGGVLALGADGLLIGAAAHSVDGAAAAGAVYLLERSGAQLSHSGLLSAADASANAHFGSSLALDGDSLFVGAPFDGEAGPLSGAAYVFERTPLASAYCFCARAPVCGNADADAGCANSSGAGALLVASGSARVANDDLVLQALDLPARAVGLLYMGAGTIHLPLGDGLRCVDWGGVGIFRFAVERADELGRLAQGPGLVGAARERFGAQGEIVAGQTWHFQCWYRDPAGPCSSGHNQSNALAVRFLP